MGNKTVSGLTAGGGKLNIKFQVTQVGRPLVTSSKSAVSGHDAVFNLHGESIKNLSTGNITNFGKADGVFVLDVWMKTNQYSSGGSRP